MDFAIGMAVGGWFVRLVCKCEASTGYVVGFTIAAVLASIFELSGLAGKL